MRVMLRHHQAQSPALCCSRCQLCPPGPLWCFPGLHTHLPTALFHSAVLHLQPSPPPFFPSLSRQSRAHLQHWSHSDTKVTSLTSPAWGSSSLAELASPGDENLVLWAAEQPCCHVLGLFPTIPVLPAVMSCGCRHFMCTCTFPNSFNFWGGV